VRKTSIAVAALTAVLALAACGSGGADTPAGGESLGQDQDLSGELLYSFWQQDQLPWVEAAADSFMEQHPDVSIEIDVTPWEQYWTKLRTQASSGTLPDIFWMNGPNFGLYAGAGMLEPLPEAVDAEPFPESLIDLYTFDGVSYAVPMSYDTVAVWLNTELFERAGVALPEPDWTFEDYHQIAADITAALGAEGIYGSTSDTLGGQTSTYNSIFAAGGTVIEDGTSGYDSPETQRGVQFWVDLVTGGVAPTPQQLTDTPANQWFLSERAAMFPMGSWFRAALDDSGIADKVKVYPFPQDANRATVIHGVSHVVAADSANLEAAQAFQAYLASEEVAQTIGESGTVIPAFDGAADAYVNSLPEDAQLHVFIDAVEYSFPLPVSTNTAEWNAVEAELMPAAMSGERTVEDVTSELAERMNEILADE